MADFDVVVIGSGFGGAVAACRLAEAGSTVLVLERGRRWKRQEYPSVSRDDWIWDDDNPHQANGGSTFASSIRSRPWLEQAWVEGRSTMRTC